MPTSETGKLSKTRGFTLIEILVVIVIVATMISIAVLSLGIAGEDEEVETERRRLAALVETIQDEAMMQGREFGIEFMTSGYRFVEFDPLGRQWMEIPGDDLFRARQLPEDLEFELYIEEKRVQLNNDPKKLEDPDKSNLSPTAELYAPHLFLFASGEGTIFELRLRRPRTDFERVLLGDILGQITFAEHDEDYEFNAAR